MTLPLITSNLHRWIVGLAGALTIISGGWVLIDVQTLGIPVATGAVIAALAGLLTLLATALRVLTDPQPPASPPVA